MCYETGIFPELDLQKRTSNFRIKGTERFLTDILEHFIVKLANTRTDIDFTSTKFEFMFKNTRINGREDCVCLDSGPTAVAAIGFESVRLALDRDRVRRYRRVQSLGRSTVRLKRCLRFQERRTEGCCRE